MDINRLTEKTQEALQAAQSEALRRSNQQVDVEHLLAALLSQEGGLAASILKRAGANVETLNARLDQDLDRLPKVSGAYRPPDQIYVTPRLNKLFTKAEDEAKHLKDDFISVEHFLLAAVDDSKAFKNSASPATASCRPCAKFAAASASPAKSRSHLRGPGKVWPRSDEKRRSRQARPRHRPR